MSLLFLLCWSLGCTSTDGSTRLDRRRQVRARALANASRQRPVANRPLPLGRALPCTTADSSNSPGRPPGASDPVAPDAPVLVPRAPGRAIGVVALRLAALSSHCPTSTHLMVLVSLSFRTRGQHSPISRSAGIRVLRTRTSAAPRARATWPFDRRSGDTHRRVRYGPSEHRWRCCHWRTQASNGSFGAIDKTTSSYNSL